MRRLASIGLLCVFVGLGLAKPLRETPRSFGEFVDPDKDCQFKVDAGKLTIMVPGTDHDLGIERGKMNAPRALQPVEGDFTIQVKVSGVFAPLDMNNQDRRAYHGAGLVIFKDDKTYIRLDRATYWDGMGNQVYGNFELRRDGQNERFGTPDDLRLDPGKDTWVSVAGTAHVREDLAKKQELFNMMAKAWFPGGPEDPDLELVEVVIDEAEYWNVKENKLLQLFKMAKAAATGTRPKGMGEHAEIDFQN